MKSGRRGGIPLPDGLSVPSYIGIHRAIGHKGGYMSKRKLKREMKSLRQLLRFSREIDGLEGEVRRAGVAALSPVKTLLYGKIHG